MYTYCRGQEGGGRSGTLVLHSRSGKGARVTASRPGLLLDETGSAGNVLGQACLGHLGRVYKWGGMMDSSLVFDNLMIKDLLV